MSEDKKIKLFIIEEHQLYRQMYQKCLVATGAIEIIELLEDNEYRSLRDIINHNIPDVLLIGLRKMNSKILHDLSVIKKEHPGLGIIITLAEERNVDTEKLKTIFAQGAHGFALFKKMSFESVEHMVKTIIAVNQGQVILDPSLVSSLLTVKTENTFLSQLTTRELQILNLIAMGYTNSTIADTLFIDIKTVEHHLNSIYSKLKVDPEYSNKHLRVSVARIFYEYYPGKLLKTQNKTEMVLI